MTAQIFSSYIGPAGWAYPGHRDSAVVWGLSWRATLLPMDFLELQERLNARAIELLGHGFPLSEVEQVTLSLLEDQEFSRLYTEWKSYQA